MSLRTTAPKAYLQCDQERCTSHTQEREMPALSLEDDAIEDGWLIDPASRTHFCPRHRMVVVGEPTR